MTRTQALIMATLGSALLLLGAWAFQHIGGLAPCKLCIWQRWPHAFAVGIGILALIAPRAELLWFGAIAALTTAGVGFYHVGVEQAWWQGPTTCSAAPIGGMSADALLDQILTAPLVRCDDIAWQMLGLSMAGWNALLSFGLMCLWLEALRRA